MSFASVLKLKWNSKEFLELELLTSIPTSRYTTPKLATYYERNCTNRIAPTNAINSPQIPIIGNLISFVTFHSTIAFFFRKPFCATRARRRKKGQTNNFPFCFALGDFYQKIIDSPASWLWCFSELFSRIAPFAIAHTFRPLHVFSLCCELDFSRVLLVVPHKKA